jgi:hypothetical protein
MKLCAFCVVWFRALFVLIASQYWNTVGQYEGNRMLYWFVDGVIAFTQPSLIPLRPATYPVQHPLFLSHILESAKPHPQVRYSAWIFKMTRNFLDF